MKAVLSIHDATPFFADEIEYLLHRLDGYKKSWLITPMWKGNHALTETFASMFNGDEKILHGLTHEGKQDFYSQVLFLNKDLSREFRGLSKSETSSRITQGKTIFEDFFNQSPEGFIPPNWYHNKYSLDILRDLGFSFSETWTRVFDLEGKITYRGLPMSFDYGNNFVLSRICLWYSRMEIEYRKPSFVRFAIHPQDVDHGFIDAIIDRLEMMKHEGYEFCSYREITAQS